MMSTKNMQIAKEAILRRNATDSFSDIVNSQKNAFLKLRVLFASDVSGVDLKFEETPNIANIFTGKGLLAYSREIEQQMANGKANIEFERRVLFDTNLLSDMPKFFSGQSFNDPKHKDKVRNILNFVDEKLDRSFDFYFAALENLLEARKLNNPYPHRKVAAAKAYDKFGSTADSNHIESYSAQAESFWLDLLTNEEAWKSLHRRDLVYCMLLKAQLLRWSEIPLNESVLELVRLSLDCFGKVALKEIYFGWKMLRGNFDATLQMDIFNEKDLIKRTKNSASRISALAWDLFVFRYCETLLTQHKGNKFFIPVVSTFDDGLLQAIKLCPLRALIMDDVAKQVETVFDDEFEFQKCLNTATVVDASITNRLRNPQLQGLNVPNFTKVSDKIRELESMVHC